MLNVAVGIIKNEHGEILISQRAKHVHQGGLWEFPGGKIEAGESTFQALKRELFEELDITISSAEPFLQITHHYPDLSVLLDIYTIETFTGQAKGMEQQTIAWVPVKKLTEHQFPAANKRIVETLLLPAYYPIVDESSGAPEQMMIHLDVLICKGYTMFQLRAKSLTRSDFKKLAKQALQKCQEHGCTLFLNTGLKTALELNAKHVHLSSKALLQSDLCVPNDMSVAVSCHSRLELDRAQALGALFSLLSPVNKTSSHLEAEPLGWNQFGDLIASLPMPVYALGGLAPYDLEMAQSKGAAGVSGIRAF